MHSVAYSHSNALAGLCAKQSDNCAETNLRHVEQTVDESLKRSWGFTPSREMTCYTNQGEKNRTAERGEEYELKVFLKRRT
jgi:hypothetical protein